MLWYTCLIKHAVTLLQTKDCCTYSFYKMLCPGCTYYAQLVQTYTASISNHNWRILWKKDHSICTNLGGITSWTIYIILWSIFLVWTSVLLCYIQSYRISISTTYFTCRLCGTFSDVNTVARNFLNGSNIRILKYFMKVPWGGGGSHLGHPIQCNG
jgi:hypothetical protein